MKASGNGNPEQCALNLLRCVRGEVPYERLKGRSAELTDAPISSMSEVEADAQWVLGTYEPRFNVEKIDLAGMIAAGDLNINANIRIIREREEP